MPRPPKCRWITVEPTATVFKPAGVAGRALAEVRLGLDELEALRLADLEGLYHAAAAERMRVSRPTFGRLVAEARRKVAEALLNSKALVFKGGHVTMAEMRVFECNECGTRFEVPFGTGRPSECPACESPNVCRADAGGRERSRRHGDAGPGGAGGSGSPRRRRRGAVRAAGRYQETSEPSTNVAREDDPQ